MKIIPKFQQGGFASFFTSYQPAQQPAQRASQSQAASASQPSKSSEKETGKLTEKDLFQMLEKVDALPNELAELGNSLLGMLEFDRLTGNTSDIATAYIQNLMKVKTYSSNKKAFDETIKNANENGIMGEYAIDLDGRLVVQKKDSGELDSVTLEKFAQNQDKYTPLTNSNLAWLRSNSKSFISKNKIFDIINNGMSFEIFQDLVDKAKASLGTTDLTHKSQINATTTQEAMKGLQVLQQLSQTASIEALGGISVKGLYDYELITKDQTKQINSLISYMQRVLPKNAKTWASIKTNILDSDKALESLLLQYLGSSQNISYSFNIDLTKTEKDLFGDKEKSKKSSSESGFDKFQQNVPSQFIAGYGEKQNFIINPGSQYSLKIMSNTLPLTNAEGKNLGTMCTLFEVAQGEWGGSLDWNNVTMGGRKISSDYFNQVLLSDGYAHSIDYPVLPDGNPDLRPKTLAHRQKAEDELKKIGVDINDPESVMANKEKVSQILESNQLPAMFDKDGRYIIGAWKRFAVINAIADNEILGVDPIDRDVPILKPITDDNRLDQRDRVLTEKLKVRYKTDHNWISWNNDTVYEGTLWIPLYTDQFNALAGSGSKIKPEEAVQLEIQQQVKDILSNYNNPGAF